MSNDTLVGEDNVEVIKSLSKKQATARSVVHNIPMKRLNDILASTGLIRAKISADSNCFFNATLHQIKDMCNIKDTAMLRQEVCNHLMAYKEEYIHFIRDNTLTKQQQSELFEHEVSDLRKEGHWIPGLSDATLLCIGNIFQCTAKVYTSIIDMPIINVVPSIKVITKNQYSE